MFWAETTAGTLDSASAQTAVAAHNLHPRARVTRLVLVIRSSRCCSKDWRSRPPSWEQVKLRHASRSQFSHTAFVEETDIDGGDAAAHAGGRIRGHAVHAVEHIDAARSASHGRSIVGGAELLA